MGRRVRLTHDCGQGTVLMVSREATGYSAYCFRCNDSDWVPPQPEALAVRLARLTARQQADAALLTPALPEPRVSWGWWPASAKLWLLKAGLGAPDAGNLGAYYHPPSDRVVLPVLDPSTGLPVFWQARACDGRAPKYLNPGAGKTRAVPQYGAADTVTLTEDILSAYKVGKVGEGWCLMGTRISSYCLTLLMQRGCDVNVWLDPDPAGRKGAQHTMDALRGAGVKCRVIHGERDPKLLHLETIDEILKG